MMTKMSTHEFNKMYEKYKNILYRIAFTYVKNNEDVEDILQEVFIKRIYHTDKFESEEHEKRWMIRVTVNMAKNSLGSFWNKNKMTVDELLESSEIMQWQFNEEEKMLFAEIMNLPEKQRVAIFLHYFEGYSCNEIAEIVKCKESAVKMRLQKGRELLKLSLSQEELV